MADAYAPGEGATRGRVGTPDVLSMLALEESLRVWEGVNLEALRAKSLELTDFFLGRVREYAPVGMLTSLTPAEHSRRGSQISLLCEGELGERAEEIMAELHRRGVVGDFRRPGVLRFGFTPLYTSFADVERAARTLADVLRE